MSAAKYLRVSIESLQYGREKSYTIQLDEPKVGFMFDTLVEVVREAFFGGQKALGSSGDGASSSGSALSISPTKSC